METSNFVKQEVSQNAQPSENKQKEIDDDMYGVFVGDLTDDVDEKDLHDFFMQIGPVVKCKIIRNPQTGLSKRYGFVHFRSEDLRQKAILELNNCLFRGQPIMVRTQHYKETDKCLVKPGTRPTDVYIGNIPRNLNKSDVAEEVGKWSIPKVKDIRTFRNESGCYCFLCFSTEKDAQTSLTLLKDESNPRLLGGRSLLIQGSTSVRNDLSTEPQIHLMTETVEDRQIKIQVENMKAALGGPHCPLTERQLVLLEKSQRTLYVRNLHPNTTEKALQDTFSKFGSIRKVIIVTDRETKVPMGYGFIEFVTAEACTLASSQPECQLDGQQLTLQISRPPRDIHAIITAAGLTDINGTLLLQYRCPPPQQTYYQNPKTGQLFVGSLEHANQYAAQGYVLLQPQTVMSPQSHHMMPQQQILLTNQVNPLAFQQSNFQQQILLQPQILSNHNQQAAAIQQAQLQQLQQQAAAQQLQQHVQHQAALQQQSLIQAQQTQLQAHQVQQQTSLQSSQLQGQPVQAQNLQSPNFGNYQVWSMADLQQAQTQMQATSQPQQQQPQTQQPQQQLVHGHQNLQTSQLAQNQLATVGNQAALQRALSQYSHQHSPLLAQQNPNAVSNLVSSQAPTDHLLLNQQRFNPY